MTAYSSYDGVPAVANTRALYASCIIVLVVLMHSQLQMPLILYVSPPYFYALWADIPFSYEKTGATNTGLHPTRERLIYSLLYTVPARPANAPRKRH